MKFEPPSDDRDILVYKLADILELIIASVGRTNDRDVAEEIAVELWQLFSGDLVGVDWNRISKADRTKWIENATKIISVLYKNKVVL